MGLKSMQVNASESVTRMTKRGVELARLVESTYMRYLRDVATVGRL